MFEEYDKKPRGVEKVVGILKKSDLINYDKGETKVKKIIFHAWDAVQAQKDGKKMTATDLIILMRSRYTHLEIQFVDRNGVSFSSTMADGADGCRFKYIEYSNPLRWKSVEFTVSDWQEQQMWEQACRMADISTNWQTTPYCTITKTGLYQGENHVKYDKYGLMSFSLERSKQWYVSLIRGIVWGWTNCIAPADDKVWCSEACLIVWNAGCASRKEMVIPEQVDPEKAIEELQKIKGE